MSTEVRTRWTELLELEEMLPQLVVSALKLPPGVERRDTLLLVGSFRDRILAMKWAEVEQATANRRRRFNRKRNGPAAEVPSDEVTFCSPHVGRVAAGPRHEKALPGAGATGQGFEERAATMLEAAHTETN